MSLAQDLIGGFQATRSIREKKLQRQFEDEMEEKKRNREVERDAKQERLARDLQTERITSDAQKFFSGQEFTGRENALNRGHQTSERVGSQEYGSGETDKKLKAGATESALEREARKTALDRQLGQDMEKFRTEMPLRGAQVGTQMRAQEWQENPDNPYNRIRDAQAEKLGSDYGSLPPVGGQFSAKDKPGSGTPTAIASQADFDKLPSGARFIWNGRVGTKP